MRLCITSLIPAWRGKALHAWTLLGRCTSGGLSRPMQIWTRRLWPSETLCMRHSGSISSTCITLSRLAGSTPGRLLIICEAGMSPCSTQAQVVTLAAMSA